MRTGLSYTQGIGFGRPRASYYRRDGTITVQVAGGRVTDVAVEHKENITLGADRIVPELIVARQDLNVDAVTGATKTGDAIRHACYEALCKAGLTVPPSAPEKPAE